MKKYDKAVLKMTKRTHEQLVKIALKRSGVKKEYDALEDKFILFEKIMNARVKYKKLSSTRKPTHPGAILREDIFPELNMTKTEIAMRLGVSRCTISEIINEHRPITADIAIRLAHFLGGYPNSWLNMQQALDIWILEQQNKIEYNQIQPI